MLIRSWPRRSLWISLLLITVLTLFLALPGCTLVVAGQAVPKHALEADPDQFVVPDDIAVLHYYGVGGWGVQWRGEYLLTAPYFSNHGLLDFKRKKGPDLESIQAGIRNTPFADAGLILVGHGHVDHAADIPAYADAGLAPDQAGLIANRTTLNMLAELLPPEDAFRCAEAPTQDGQALSQCTLPGFRITPLASNHAPNIRILGKAITVSTGTLDDPLENVPERPSDYLLGQTWAYLIDLLDADGEVVFRIHYMDAVAGSDQASIPAELQAERDIDVHIACVPGYNYVDDYPEWVIEQGNTGYVLLGHWEDFFRPRDKRLKPVSIVLSERKLNTFVQRIEKAMPAEESALTPANKSDDDCPVDANQCGPRGKFWALPVPGETYHFKPDRLSRKHQSGD